MGALDNLTTDFLPLLRSTIRKANQHGARLRVLSKNKPTELLRVVGKDALDREVSMEGPASWLYKQVEENTYHCWHIKFRQKARELAAQQN